MISFKHFWYIAAHSNELNPNKLLSRIVVDESLVLYRGFDGKARAMQDRCLHRQGKLSLGRCHKGTVTCPYHGWQYNESGKVVSIPSLGPSFDEKKAPTTISYPTHEQDGYIYVRLETNPNFESKPHAMLYYKKRGWKNIRLVNNFESNLNNCIENFIDIPHTAYVHRTLFRKPLSEKITASVSRHEGIVHVKYQNERSNLGIFSKLLNPNNQAVSHTDTYYMPNITSVHYQIGDNIQFIITSQSVPIDDKTTRVYTDISFNFGRLTFLAPFFVKRLATAVIEQDKKILKNQRDILDKYGKSFRDTPADKIHQYVDSILDALFKDTDPRKLPVKQHDIEFYV